MTFERGSRAGVMVILRDSVPRLTIRKPLEIESGIDRTVIVLLGREIRVRKTIKQYTRYISAASVGYSFRICRPR